MAAALSVSSHAEARNAVTVTGSGLSLSTDYNLVITDAGGFTATRKVTTDGSGGFTFPWVPQGTGKVTYRLDSFGPTAIVTVVSGSERRS